FADEPDLRFELVARFPGDRRLGEVDQRPDVGGRRASEVHDDVRVLVEDPGVPVHVPLEPARVDEAAGADAFDLLEDRARARVEPEVGVPLVPPREVLAHDSPELRLRGRLEAERHVQHDVAAVVQDAVIVPEPEVRPIDRPALAFLRQDLGGLDDLFDEDGPFTLRRGREEVQILPHRAADGARDPDEVVKPAEPTRNGRLDQVVEDLDAALHTDPAIVQELDPPALVPNDETTKPSIPDEDVRTHAQDEVGDPELPGCDDRLAEFGRAPRAEEEVRGPTDLERRIRRERDVTLDPVRAEPIHQLLMPTVHGRTLSFHQVSPTPGSGPTGPFGSHPARDDPSSI